jgi:hypothetical protein
VDTDFSSGSDGAILYAGAPRFYGIRVNSVSGAGDFTVGFTVP